MTDKQFQNFQNACKRPIDSIEKMCDKILELGFEKPQAEYFERHILPKATESYSFYYATEDYGRFIQIKVFSRNANLYFQLGLLFKEYLKK